MRGDRRTSDTLARTVSFRGASGPYRESDLPDATDLYGRSKLLGEVSAPNCLTLRTSIIGRELGSHHGLLDWFLRQDKKEVRGFSGALHRFDDD